MPDRLTSDHPTIDTIRGHLARHGGTGRRIDLPASAASAVPPGSVVRTSVEETTYFARCREIADEPAIVGLYATSHGAETGRGREHLRDVLGGWERDRGDTVLVDVLEPGEHLGLRAPGTTAHYEVSSGVDDDLAAIAEELANEED